MPTRAMVNGGGIESVGCVHVVSGANNELYSINEDERILVGKKVAFKKKVGLIKNDSCTRSSICCSDESSSSSIGENSDLSESNNSNEKQPENHEEEEVESSYKGPLDAMKALEEVLPIRRGISIFYNGKPKSFASLADAAASSSSSIKDIAKLENAYVMRRRRSLLAWDKTRSSPLRGISSKRANKTTLALAVAMSSSNNSSEHENDDKQVQHRECYMVGGSLLASSSSRRKLSHWRSFSMADLQQCASVATTCLVTANQLPSKPYY